MASYNGSVFLVFLLFFATALPVVAEQISACVSVRQEVEELSSDAELINAEIAQHRSELRLRGLESAYCSELLSYIQNTAAAIRKGTLPKTTEALRRAPSYERFRLEMYLSSGVAPKRYIGFLDEEGDTAGYERILRHTAVDGVKMTNEYAASRGLTARITEREIVVTFLAEGGALLLTTPEYHTPNRVHPVRGIGLDDLRIGFAAYPDLVERFDTYFRTRLRSILLPTVKKSLILRPMTFREAILATTLMYLYEKELTASKVRSEWKLELMSLPLEEQFIATSLVYNSGILFSRERVQQINELSTVEYLAKVNAESNRPCLSVYGSREGLERLQRGEPIPQQLTSWSAVYHILQRYGAWVALERFTGVFSAGDFVHRVKGGA